MRRLFGRFRRGVSFSVLSTNSPFPEGFFIQDSCDRCRFLFRYSLVRQVQRRQRPVLGVFVQGVIVSLPTNWVLQFLFFLSTPALFSFPPLVFRFLFLFLVSVSRFSFLVFRFLFLFLVPVSRAFRFRSCFPFPPSFLSPLSASRSRSRLLPPPVLASCFRPHLFLSPLVCRGIFALILCCPPGLPLTQRSSNLGFRISE